MSSAAYPIGRHLEARPRRTSHTGASPTVRRRRLLAVLLLVVALSVVLVVMDRGGAEASLEDQVAGHVVVEPGESLWDVAVSTAADDVDPRQQLADLRELNGIDGAHVDEWTVVLIPAR